MSHPPVRILICGAASSGVTTLGQNLAWHLNVVQMHVDDYYWQASNPPYTTKRSIPERMALIRQALGSSGWMEPIARSHYWHKCYMI